MKTELMIREPDLYFDSIHNELNNFLRDTFLHPSFSNPLTIKKNSIWRPAVEIKQNDKEYKVKVQLPGVEKNDIDVELDNDFMTITAEIEEEKEQKEEKEINEKYHTVNTSVQYLLISQLKHLRQKLNIKMVFYA